MILIYIVAVACAAGYRLFLSFPSLFVVFDFVVVAVFCCCCAVVLCAGAGVDEDPSLDSAVSIGGE